MLPESLAAIETRYKEINQQIEENLDDYQKVAELSKERADLDPIIEKSSQLRQKQKSLEEAQMLLDSSNDEEMRILAQEDIQTLEPQIATLEEELKNLLVPKDPRNQRNVIMEIRAGTGGDEAGLFAADLFRMYTRYADTKGWKIEILSQNETGIGGFKEIILWSKGKAPIPN